MAFIETLWKKLDEKYTRMLRAVLKKILEAGSHKTAVKRPLTKFSFYKQSK